MSIDYRPYHQSQVLFLATGLYHCSIFMLVEFLLVLLARYLEMWFDTHLTVHQRYLQIVLSFSFCSYCGRMITCGYVYQLQPIRLGPGFSHSTSLHLPLLVLDARLGLARFSQLVCWNLSSNTCSTVHQRRRSLACPYVRSSWAGG